MNIQLEVCFRNAKTCNCNKSSQIFFRIFFFKKIMSERRRKLKFEKMLLLKLFFTNIFAALFSISYEFMVFCLFLLGKDKNQTNFECNYVCPSSQIKCGHQAQDEISLRVHKAQCSKIRKKREIFWDILHTICYDPKILKLTFSAEEIRTFKNDFTKTMLADFIFLFDFMISWFYLLIYFALFFWF